MLGDVDATPVFRHAVAAADFANRVANDAGGFGTVSKSPSPLDTAISGGACHVVFAGSSPITTTSPSSKAHQKSGPFAPPA